MISTKHISIDHIPTNWVFEYYCKLDCKLTGQDIKIKSLVNPSEKTPSLSIYCKDNIYYFNDFSSGLKGTVLSFVKKHFNLSEEETIKKMCIDYENNKTGEISIIQTEEKYVVSSFAIRNWEEKDARFWTSFNINSNLLNKYNVKPLKHVTLSKSTNVFKLQRPLLYGYFKKDGSLYKVYEPYSKSKTHKFLSLQPYIQGIEQLEYKKPVLIIASSMKDMLSILSFTENIEVIAPNSENSFIDKNILSSLSLKYKYIFTLFDNDEAGNKAMIAYKERFNITGIHVNLAKDISDSISEFGLIKTKKIFMNNLNLLIG